MTTTTTDHPQSAVARQLVERVEAMRRRAALVASDTVEVPVRGLLGLSQAANTASIRVAYGRLYHGLPWESASPFGIRAAEKGRDARDWRQAIDDVVAALLPEPPYDPPADLVADVRDLRLGDGALATPELLRRLHQRGWRFTREDDSCGSPF